MKHKSTYLALAAITIASGFYIHSAAAPSLPDNCVGHAAEEATNHEHWKILLVRYNEIAVGHAYCIYAKGGQAFGWDWRGPVAIINDGNALSVAKSLPTPLAGLTVRSAEFVLQK